MSELVAFFEAYDATLTPLFNAGSVLELVAGAEAAGLIDALRTPASIEELAASTGIDALTIATICRALLTTAVVTQADDRFVLADAWLAVTNPGGFVTLGAAIAGHVVERRALRAAAGGLTYWSMPAEDRLAYARAVSPNPYSDELVESFRHEIEEDPDRRGMLEGGRLLELGCGVAGRVLATLRAAPNLTAVGVELSDDLAAEAQRRATELGLSDRFTVVCADAATYRDDDAFDFGFWSQFFFPEAARAPALASMLRALSPGAVFLAPVGHDGGAAMADPTSQDARDFALWRVVLHSWGIPERRPDELVAEVQNAGFADVRIVPRPASPLLRAARPQPR